MRAAVVDTPAKLSKGSRELMQECASEFVSFIVSEAAERAADNKAKMVTAEDVLAALEALDFDSYVDPLGRFVENFRAVRALYYSDFLFIYMSFGF